MASNANWFGAYARWAGLSDGDAIDTERRNKVVARMKERLDAAMPRASDVLSDRAPGFLLDLYSALYAIDHGKPFQVETVRTLARALEDSPCKVVAAGYLDRGSLGDAARVARKAKDYCMSDHLRNLLAAVEAERNRVL